MHILLIQIICQNSSSVYYFRQRDILIFESDFFMFWLFCKLLHIKVGKVLFAWLQQTIPDAADIFSSFQQNYPIVQNLQILFVSFIPIPWHGLLRPCCLFWLLLWAVSHHSALPSHHESMFVETTTCLGLYSTKHFCPSSLKFLSCFCPPCRNKWLEFGEHYLPVDFQGRVWWLLIITLNKVVMLNSFNKA